MEHIVEFLRSMDEPEMADEVANAYNRFECYSTGIKNDIIESFRSVAENKWQPIETAPKDEFVLLAGPSGYTTIKTVFTTGRMCSDYHAGRWIDHANDDLTDWGFNPTHWMPLPKPPAMAQGEK